jgi:hypothetical protein
LGAVIDAVEVELLAGIVGGIGEEEVAGAQRLGRVVLAEHFHREDAGAGAGLVGGAAGLVGKAAGGDGVAPHVGEAVVEGTSGHGGAAVGGAAESHELPAGDRDVGVAGGGVVAPAAGVRHRLGPAVGEPLGREDQLDAFRQGALDPLPSSIVHHAVDLAQHRGANAVLVHHRVVVGGGERAVIALGGDDVVDALVEQLAVGSLPGDVTAGEERHDGQRRDGGGGAAAVGPGAVGGLVPGEPVEGLVDRSLDVGRDRFVLGDRPRGRCQNDH